MINILKKWWKPPVCRIFPVDTPIIVKNDEEFRDLELIKSWPLPPKLVRQHAIGFKNN